VATYPRFGRCRCALLKQSISIMRLSVTAPTVREQTIEGCIAATGTARSQLNPPRVRRYVRGQIGPVAILWRLSQRGYCILLHSLASRSTSEAVEIGCVHSFVAQLIRVASRWHRDCPIRDPLTAQIGATYESEARRTPPTTARTGCRNAWPIDFRLQTCRGSGRRHS
jgi:hypothetical protein